MEDIETLQKILIEYKYSKKQLYRNVIRFFYKKYPNAIFESWLCKHIKREIEIAVFDLEMLFYEAENEILMRDGYLNGKISLNISSITKGKYKNKFYFSDLLKIKEELL
jgi:hypothetical protein